jgi:F-type H+-transporting ATPase subunit delta
VSNRAIARRYAKALSQIGQEQGKLVEFQQELAAIDGLVRGNTDLQRLVSYPLIAPVKRNEAFNAILVQAGAGDTVRKFFEVVTLSARLSLLHDIVAAYNDLVDEAQGVVEAQVSTAQPMSGMQTQHLATSLGGRTGKTVRVQWKQDPTLLGGLRVQVGSTVYDASLQGQLRLLKAQLLSA